MTREETDYIFFEETYDWPNLDTGWQQLVRQMEKEEKEWDPEKLASEISRSLCEPTEKLYKRETKLKDNPLDAIKEVKLSGVNEESITDPVEGLLVAAAKLETTKKELNLSPKQTETFNGFLENIKGASAFLKSKAAKSIATGTLIVSQALIAAGCGDIIRAYTEPLPTIPPIIETVVVTATPQNTPTPEPTPTITPTETVKAEVMKVLLNEKVEYEGCSFDFSVTVPEDDTYVVSNLEKYGIESLEINEEKPNARELLAKVFAVEFLETYNFQKSANVSLDEFVSNPEKYPVEIVMRDADHQLTPKTLTLDQINSFELRIVSSGKYGELYMNMPSYTKTVSGYSFENGKFVLYQDFAGVTWQLDSVTKAGYGKGSDIFPYFVGYATGYEILGTSLGQMPYTVFKLVQHGRDESLNIQNIFNLYDQTLNYDQVQGAYLDSKINEKYEEYKEWLKTHLLFMGIIK